MTHRVHTFVAPLVLLAVLLLGRTEASAAGKTLTVYHIGNSVTDTLNYTGLGQLATAGGNTYTYGRDIIPGAPLSWIWDNSKPPGNNGFSEQPYGLYPNALPNFTWNAVTLQPFDRLLQSDREACTNFINLALTKAANKSTQFYIYSRWPRRDRDPNNSSQYLPIDYHAKWDRKYTGGWDNTNETKDYFQQLVDVLNKDYAGKLDKPIRMIPVGDVLDELNTRIKAGKIPGLTDINQLYVDGIHFNNVGSYVVGLTFYATMFKADPRGLPVTPAYQAQNLTYTGSGDAVIYTAIPITGPTADALQKTVWDVVSVHPYAGVAVPEPASLGLLTFGGLTLLARPQRMK